MSDAPRLSQRGVPSVVQRVLRSGQVWAIQGLGTLLWLALAYAWLWIREARWWELASSMLLAGFLAYVAVFLQRSALRVYRRDRLGVPGLAAAGRRRRHRALREWLPGAALVFALFVALVWLSDVLQGAVPDATEHLASWLTLHLRRPVDPYLLQQRVESIEFVGAWFLFVVVWLPLAAAALLGERWMWRATMRAWRRLRYWLGTLACAVVGHVAFWKLAGWVPRARGIAAQSASMLARLSLGFVIALGAWLVILALVEEAISNRGPRSPDDTWD
ncbi:MAG TPA: hypothetical protein VJW51_08810 [Candidatus Acidoferrales bacterium]|nr:hypothetical protein [Candidatus Acidoferrales bacterium]